MGGLYATRVGHRADYETCIYQISTIISPEEWEGIDMIHVRQRICFHG